jgi:hypothetical protein
MNFKVGSVLGTSALAMTLMLAACGSDDNSSNVERGDDGSSSSVEEKSSSSTTESSSSEDVDVPKGTRAATLDDLEKNMTLGEMFGTELYFASGNKQGVFSLWIQDASSMAVIAVHSDFKGGVIKVSTDNGSFMGSDSKSADEMQDFMEKTATLKFIVNEKDQLQVSINDGDYKDVKKSPVDVDRNDISDANELHGTKLTCKNESEKLEQVYSFYKDSYIVEEKVGDSTTWSAGAYDIQGGYLLMVTELFESEAYSLVMASLSKKFKLSIQAGSTLECTKAELDTKEVDGEKLTGSWVAYDEDTKWALSLDSNGDYTLEWTLSKVPQGKRSGVWAVFGDQLILMNKSCTVYADGSKCKSAVKGAVEKLDPEKGFTYKHNDSAPVPTEWELPQYE